MTQLIYMDSHDGTYTRDFTAMVTAAVDGPEGPVVELDRSAFYLLGGGQPSDKGRLRWDGQETAIKIVRKKHRVRHILAGKSRLPDVGTKVEGILDWDRRYAHMRMHTAQHLVSAVVDQLHGGRTVGNQIGESKSRIDFKPLRLDPEQLSDLEHKVNQTLEDDLPVGIRTMALSKLEAMPQLVRADLTRLPPHIKELRVITIGNLDVCPCAGTHVRSTSELGRVRFTKRDNKGAGKQRLTYVLGSDGPL